MQWIVTGVDADGRSCVVTNHDPGSVMSGNGISLLEPLFESTQVPPPSRPAGAGELMDLGVGPGLVRWQIVEFEPGRSFEMHHTDTVDLDTVLTGSIELVLDDGAHPLGPGDCAVVNGVDHGWRAGPEGCRLMSVIIGTTPPVDV